MDIKSKILATAVLAVFCLGTARADESNAETDSKLKEFKREETKDILDHLETKQNPGERFKPIKLEAKKSVHYKMKVEQKNDEAGRKCHAEVAIGYLQFNTRARVDTAVDNKDCAASSGKYEIQLQIVDANNQAKIIEHVESWARNNKGPVESRKFYDIGSKVELMRAMVRGVTCTCDAEGRKNK